ncbi:hypothetical protein KIL84_002250 [Mauremys mutica]|uniref:Uncharacterized protein n=1 Tax=Mauremys mutica TaxID=74926 RepID=A0A9D4AZ32_9SAUR|nr:hypothetical protein KIL84_002250 [Mauremys mutica]
MFANCPAQEGPGPNAGRHWLLPLHTFKPYLSPTSRAWQVRVGGFVGRVCEGSQGPHMQRSVGQTQSVQWCPGCEGEDRRKKTASLRMTKHSEQQERARQLLPGARQGSFEEVKTTQ